ncbi:MAG: DegT/DnrJ/EryC1/StrS family aminotransferase [Smithellaceae bacterium]|jgi:8-amino-3,8-dideoxy-alpha-D-manno-octulosonate transaminase|nr:DegT/DnrJ/EryC1/StrS family aminotransferase [Smithellaceae bacterium]
MAGTEIFDSAEIKAVTDVIERKMIHRYGSHAVRNGQYRVDEFEDKVKALTGARYALGVSSGTAALIVALKGIGIQPGDEIITTPFTFIATIEAIVALNAVPILGDIDETLSLDAASVERLITPKTRAIMPVHMFGVAADMDRFTALAKKHNIPVIEDACEVVGGTYKGRCLGTLGKCGTWSFDPNKTLTVGEGGIILTDDEAVYLKMEYYHDHGHVHSKAHDRGADAKSGLGVNYRLSEIQGALGLVALDKMPKALGMLRATKKKILDAVAPTGIKPRPMNDEEGDTATHVIFMMPTAEAAKKFQAATKEAGCPCAIIAENTWHYAKHWQALEDMGEKDYFGTKTPSYAPATMAASDAILSRAVMFGLNIIMDEASVNQIITAINAGAKAAL